ncbi:YbhB/YbcL family Raf kinase inhibitor-like protein [Mycoplasma sp. 744]|uniref:YbhB/YbcL family Raf kinase inhibitor-like protein n=1 Tax=Mycoplasma sp. 744 TaxID=3108531 RepID=UPI002B1E0B86|nr:YbhB/YbcL family Raf kinase inhibitor-like protein [Mycoplasma sp. 744]MEA4115570.1 YbhB/YbcL family Raf kinase inhibitor-like protein [Mycoplasma sp. 744]
MQIKKYQRKINSSYFEEFDNKIYLKPSALEKKNNHYLNFDLSWEKNPLAKSYALILLDYEASRVIGQPFIHWIVANIKNNFLIQGANLNDTTIVQGVNSTCEGLNENKQGVLIECIPSAFKQTFKQASNYFPPMPPDDTHLYTIKIVALSKEHLDLTNGFHLSDLYEQMHDYIIDEIEDHFWYKNK